jgi:hypothetical protein
VRKYSRQSLVEENPFGSLVGHVWKKFCKRTDSKQGQSHCMRKYSRLSLVEEDSIGSLAGHAWKNFAIGK